MNGLDASILRIYEQFSVESNEAWNNDAPNFFQKVPIMQIRLSESRGKFVLPSDYIEFLTRVGWGRLKLDQNGHLAKFYQNVFMAPEEIERILTKRSLEWQIDGDFLDKDDLPFFHLGDFSMLTFRSRDRQDSSVYRPFGDELVASNFSEFLTKLFENNEFYRGSVT